MKIRIKYLILVMFLFNCKSYKSLKMEIDKIKLYLIMNIHENFKNGNLQKI